jgi:hypothetical protein
MVARNPYSQERLVRLLRLLQPAPNDWVMRAQRTIADLRGRERALAQPLTDIELAELTRALERDPSFRRSFDIDPIAATEAAGWLELARSLQQEFEELVALAERIAADDAYHEALHADVLRTLHAVDVPIPAAEPLLRALAEPDELLAKLPEVVAHQYDRETARIRRLIVLLSSTVVADTLRNRSRRH